MLAEFTVVPIGDGEGVSRHVAECVRIVDESGLDYRVNPMGTVIEGGFDEVMSVICACHKKVAGTCARVETIIRIDDRKGVDHAIRSKIESVEDKLGKRLKK
jgi:uncharacterized protein (TIGR00106 family)